MTIDFASLINSNTGSTQQSNAAKYTTAVKQAQSQLAKDGGSYSDQQLKSLIDQNYSALGGTGSGDDIRTGGYGFNKAVSGLKDILDNIDSAGGKAIDGVGDFVLGGVGDGVDAFLKGTGLQKNSSIGDTIRNAFDENDAASVMHGLTTGAVSMIPGAGIPLAVAKEAVQNSDNISEALTGRDAITGEKLDDTQKGTRAFETALSMGLAAIPGAGGAIGKAVGKAAGKEAAEAAGKEAAEAAGKEAAEAAGKEAAEAAGKEAAEAAGKEAAKGTSEKAMAETAAKEADEAVEAAANASEGAAKAGKQADDAADNAVSAEKQAMDSGSEIDSINAQQARDAEDKAVGKFVQAIKNMVDKGNSATQALRDQNIMRPVPEPILMKNAKGVGSVAKYLANSALKSGGMAAEGASGAVLQDMHNRGDDSLINLDRLLRMNYTPEELEAVGEELESNILRNLVPGRRAGSRVAAAAHGMPNRYAHWVAPQSTTLYSNDNAQQLNEDQADVNNMDERQFLAMISRMNGGK